MQRVLIVVLLRKVHIFTSNRCAKTFTYYVVAVSVRAIKFSDVVFLACHVSFQPRSDFRLRRGTGEIVVPPNQHVNR